MDVVFLFVMGVVDGKCKYFVMKMLYICVLCASCGSSQCCVSARLAVCVCGCDGDVICVGHGLQRGALDGGKPELKMLNLVGERTPPCGTPVLN